MLELVQEGESARHAHTAIAKHFKAQRDYCSAADHYRIVGDLRNQTDCFFGAKRYDDKAIDDETEPELLREIGERFRRLGYASKSSQAFVMIRNYKQRLKHA